VNGSSKVLSCVKCLNRNIQYNTIQSSYSRGIRENDREYNNVNLLGPCLPKRQTMQQKVMKNFSCKKDHKNWDYISAYIYIICGET